MKLSVKRMALLAFFGLTLVACTKEYNCSCTLDGTPNTSFQYKMKKEAAQAACEADEVLLQQDNPTGVVDCSID